MQLAGRCLISDMRPPRSVGMFPVLWVPLMNMEAPLKHDSGETSDTRVFCV